MKNINITEAKQNLYKLIKNAKTDLNPITIINTNGKNAILLSEEKWKNIEETLCLSSIPGLVKDINNIKDAENWELAKEFDPDEEW